MTDHPDHEVVHSHTTGDLRCGSPSDLTGTAEMRRVSSSPISSDLPSLFSNLRTNEREKRGSERRSNSHAERIQLSGGQVSVEQSGNGSANPLGNSFGVGHTAGNQPNGLASKVTIPPVFLKDGMPLLKVSHKSKKRILFRIDPDNFMLSWNIASTPLSSNLQRLISPGTQSSKGKLTEVSIDDIKNILAQEDATNYREELHISKEFESTWLTLFYYNSQKSKLKTLHVIADSDHDFKRLVSVLSDLKRLRDDFARNFLIDIDGLDEARRSMILSGGKQIKQFLSLEDILKYSKRLNINVSPAYLGKVFAQAAMGKSSLNFDQFKNFVNILKHREDVLAVWRQWSGGGDIMTYPQFRKFIKKVQMESYPDDHIMRIFNAFSGQQEGLSPENFNNYLSSKYASPYFELDEHYFEMPLNEYFISSSHNTYLLGRQFVGDSSIEGYIKVLQRGCRCVEVDVWDGSLGGDENGASGTEPIVSHGRTFTTAISFLNVIRTIKKYAFMTSPYPVIISLEVHCNVENQLKMVSVLKEVLGEMLVLYPIDEGFGLPSPKALKHRILVKAKRTCQPENLAVSESGKYYSTSTSTTTSFSEDNERPERKRSNSFSLRKSKTSKICLALSDLGVYLQGIKFRNFSLPESKTFNHCFSISEKSLNTMLKDEVRQTQVDKHNRRYFMRVYPSKIRLLSTNFIPVNYWAHGVQMVATNWQTYDLGQQLNEAMFEGVNKTGYVIKPMELRKPFLKSMRVQVNSERRIWFNIEIISAHQLPKPKDAAINPFVSFEIIGANSVQWGDSNATKRSEAVVENGFNPTWNQKFSGIITAANDLVFVRFSVNSEDGNEVHPIGIVISRLSDLKRGYRYLPVTDISGEELIYSHLFLRIEYDDMDYL
ncbi:1-phosphatidylinositol 4,5-bisphosphate phosphodiesterase 1 [[Candida] anglica]|uniref:Phosphoinositide phospholipase C n=1 Tax=[Candida] anglica TaxID=148631 RepID=A0ABP0E9Y8_9ASCO